MFKYVKEFFFPKEPDHIHLKDFSDKELLETLEDNENITPTFLVYICSEILRRELKSRK